MNIKAMQLLLTVFCAVTLNCAEPSMPGANFEMRKDPGPLSPNSVPEVPDKQSHQTIYWVAGTNVPAATNKAVSNYLKQINGWDFTTDLPPSNANCHPKSLILSLGDTLVGKALLPQAAATASETIEIQGGSYLQCPAVAARGTPLSRGPLRSRHIGTSMAGFALLEKLGFGFWHPFAPVIPTHLPDVATLSFKQQPHWPMRGLHLHTMHPIELTKLLNGWGPAGMDDAVGFQKSLPQWEKFLHWLLAQRQNSVQWVLLGGQQWPEFAASSTRYARLKTLVERAHAYGILVGVDVPIILRQQNTQNLLINEGELADEQQQIRDNIDTVMAAGFDFLATESGTSEFTHPEPERMLAWMNTVAEHMQERWQKPSWIKIHVSAGQKAKGYEDPRTGKTIDFNLLPHHANPNMGILAHTVQHYSLDDPAPTYGNDNFNHIREFMHLEADQRSTLWHPETAYWVSYDVDVPLYLPLYAYRRVHDARLLAADEKTTNKPIDGQMIFSSGWEWGYWFNDVIAARAAWQPPTQAKNSAAGLQELTEKVFASLPEKLAQHWAQAIVEIATLQHQLLTLGHWGELAPTDIHQRNGQAYMQGFETWDDVADLLDNIPGLPNLVVQPKKLGLVQLATQSRPNIDFVTELEPLLAAMRTRFLQIKTDAKTWLPELKKYVPSYAKEFQYSLDLLYLRATQVHALYAYVYHNKEENEMEAHHSLEVAQKALDQALITVKDMESIYRVDADNISSWETNPTAYNFGYLWTVRTLFYWWRDEFKAVEQPWTPCVMNIIDPFQVAHGEQDLASLAGSAGSWLNRVPGLHWLSDCMAPLSEMPPQLPPPGLR